MTTARSRLIRDDLVGTYHCISRCVRRAFLCGRDERTQRNYAHRKDWLLLRLQELADIFLIDICGYAIMENHFHLILRNRPDLMRQMSDEAIARRWWRLCPKRRDHGLPAEPTPEELDLVLGSPEHTHALRTRLASISWFMRCLKENIARRANAEDHCTGRFWEGRFKSIALLDQAAVLACLAYVDLNPIRAGLAETPEASPYTSAQDRILSRQAQKRQAASATSKSVIGAREPLPKGPTTNVHRADWLCPFQTMGPRQGFLDLSCDEYLALLDWTGRHLTVSKKGAIPNHLAPILNRLEIDHQHWLYSSRHFGNLFYRVAGTLQEVAKAAAACGQRWFKTQNAGKCVFQLPHI